MKVLAVIVMFALVSWLAVLLLVEAAVRLAGGVFS